MNRALLVPALGLAPGLALFSGPPQNCLAQVEPRSVPAGAPRSANGTSIGPMVRVRGSTVQTGIEASQIPGLMKTFDINVPQLFPDEVSTHSVTLDDFYIDKSS